MNNTTAHHLIDTLLEMPDFMDRAFDGLPSSLLVSAPENDESPLAEHAWHVRDCESDLYGMRIRKVLTQERPFLEPMVISHWPAERQYLVKPVRQAVLEFRDLREGLVKELRCLSVEDLQREGSRPDGGRSTVLDLVMELLRHDQDHRKRLVSILARLQASAV